MAVKFVTDVPRTLCFPYGDFKETNGQFGLQYQYTTQCNGQRDSLYATPTLHQHLQAAGVGPGVVLTVTKVESEGDDDHMNWVIQPDRDRDAEPCISAENSPQPHPDFASIQLVMNDCLQASWAAWNTLDGEAHFTSKDVRKLGISMFIQCCRKGILPQPLQQT